jgi:hypothetical protein
MNGLYGNYFLDNPQGQIAPFTNGAFQPAPYAGLLQGGSAAQPYGAAPPQFTGQQPNLYAPQSDPYQTAAPLSGGVNGSITPQMVQGLMALSSAMQKKQPAQQMPMMAAPQAQVYDGRSFTPSF